MAALPNAAWNNCRHRGATATTGERDGILLGLGALVQRRLCPEPWRSLGLGLLPMLRLASGIKLDHEIGLAPFVILARVIISWRDFSSMIVDSINHPSDRA